MKRTKAVPAGFVLVFLILAMGSGGLFASQDERARSLDNLNTQMQNTYGTAWVIPSHYSQGSETALQSEIDKKAMIENKPVESVDQAAVQLVGRRGGGETHAANVTVAGNRQVQIPGLPIPIEEEFTIPQVIMDYVNQTQRNVVSYKVLRFGQGLGGGGDNILYALVSVELSGGTYSLVWQEWPEWGLSGNWQAVKDRVLVSGQASPIDIKHVYRSNNTGDIFVVWGMPTGQNKYSFNMTSANAYTEGGKTTVFTEGTSPDSVQIYSMGKLSSGDSVIVWGGYDEKGGQCVKMRFFDYNGQRKGSECVLAHGEALSSVRVYSTAFFDAEGQTAVLWRKGNGTGDILTMQIFDYYGKLLKQWALEEPVMPAGSVLHGVAISNHEHFYDYRPSDDKIRLYWVYYAPHTYNYGYGDYTWYEMGTVKQIFDKDGVDITPLVAGAYDAMEMYYNFYGGSGVYPLGSVFMRSGSFAGDTPSSAGGSANQQVIPTVANAPTSPPPPLTYGGTGASSGASYMPPSERGSPLEDILNTMQPGQSSTAGGGGAEGAAGNNVLTEPFVIDEYLPGADYRALERAVRRSLESYARLRAAEAPVDETALLGEMAVSLAAKKDKTGIESTILDVVSAVLVESAYVDDATMREFAEAVQYIRMAESMKDMLQGVDFVAVTNTLMALADDQKRLYEDFLSTTDDLYKKIEALLQIDIAAKNLPDSYIFLTNISLSAKRKMLVDLALEEIRSKDKKALTDAERKALQIDRSSLEPLRQSYMKKLKEVVRKFVMSIRENLSGRAPVTLQSDNQGMKALFILDKSRAAQ